MKTIKLVTIICLFTTINSFAQTFSGGSGTEQDPYLISSKTDMETLSHFSSSEDYNSKDKHFLLTQNLSEITTVIDYFEGTFDGGGHTLELRIGVKKFNIGVFVRTNGATIKNLGISGIVSGYNPGSVVGGICGKAENTIISNCYNTGNISSSSSVVGGICGKAENTIISNCYNTGNISHSSSSGGICGEAYGGIISNCYNTRNISFSSFSSFYYYTAFFGGICGKAYDGVIINCYNTGNISLAYISSGICGLSADATISNCYNTGNISSSRSSSGGICGNANTSERVKGVTISNCYNTGNISGTNSASGGICGAANGVFSNCYNTGNISSSGGASYSGGICGGVNTATVSNCYSTGNISSYALVDAYSGGICGRINDFAQIRNCFAANITISGGGTEQTGDGAIKQVGRIGNINRGSVENCYASAMLVNGVVISSQDANSKDGKDEISLNLQKQSWLSDYLGWDFNTVWTIPEGGGFPVFKKTATEIESPKTNSTKIAVYPNPTGNDLFIQSNIPVEKIEIYNLSGACVLIDKLFAGKINVSHLPNGVYFVRIYSGKTKVDKKIIVKR